MSSSMQLNSKDKSEMLWTTMILSNLGMLWAKALMELCMSVLIVTCLTLRLQVTIQSSICTTAMLIICGPSGRNYDDFGVNRSLLGLRVMTDLSLLSTTNASMKMPGPSKTDGRRIRWTIKRRCVLNMTNYFLTISPPRSSSKLIKDNPS